jgi:hypothetical protein
MAKPKLTKKSFLWKAPHIGMEELPEIQRQVMDDYVKQHLEMSPPLQRLEIIVKTTR